MLPDLDAAKRAVARYFAWQGSYDRADTARGFVYVVKPFAVNVYKIGCTVDVARRVKDLQRNRAYPIDVVCTIEASDCVALESEFHLCLEAYKLAGEWFVLSAETIEYLKGVKL